MHYAEVDSRDGKTLRKTNTEISSEHEDGGEEPESPRSSPFGILVTAAWFGLIFGFLEGLFLVGWRHYFRDSPIGLDPNALWMAPITECLIFVVIGAVLVFLNRFLPRLVTFGFSCFVFTSIGSLAFLFLIPQIHPYAKWLLAFGIGVQAARLVSRWHQPFRKLVRNTLAPLAAIVPLIAIGMLAGASYLESKAVAALPPAKRNSPNVILITLDTVRAESLSLYGYNRRTSPELDRLARSGAVFDNAIAPAPWTLPTHASIFTGRYAKDLNFSWTTPLDGTYRTLAEELTSNGYETAGFVANLEYCLREVGLARGMIRYEDFPITPGQVILSGALGRELANSTLVRRGLDYHETLNRKTSEDLNDDFLNWLAKRDTQRPFFAFLNYYDAHEPLLPPEPFDGMFGPTKPTVPFEYDTNGVTLTDRKNWTGAEVERFRNAYDSSIAYQDHYLGELFERLRKLGFLENTLVIITSDHGESIGEHGIIGHGNSLYYETLHVPLLFIFPSRIPKGTRIDETVSLRALPSTILEMVGDKDNESFGDGSLYPLIMGGAWDSDVSERYAMSEIREIPWIEVWLPAHEGKMYSLVDEKYQYILNGDGTEEFFDIEIDPNERKNLINSPAVADRVEEFREALENIKESE